MARSREDPTERRLRAAIFASPDDDAPRLVYADWLLERGDPRGEFIQIQCRLGRAIPARAKHAAKSPLELREQALLRKHQKTWIAPIRGHLNSWFWQRGFVSRVDVNVKKFVTHVAAILEFTPLHAVYLMGCTPADVRRFSETPLVGSLRSLTLNMQRIGARETEVFGSPHFANLEELELPLNQLDDEAVRVLATSTSLGKLRTLDLSFSDKKLTSRGIESLSLAPFFPQLTRLVLDCSLADRTAIAPILQRGTSLTSLSLGKQKITKQESAALAARGLKE